MPHSFELDSYLLSTYYRLATNWCPGTPFCFIVSIIIIAILFIITMETHINGLRTSVACPSHTELSNGPMGVLQSQAEQDVDKCIRGKQTQELPHEFHSLSANPTLHSCLSGLIPIPTPNLGLSPSLPDLT